MELKRSEQKCIYCENTLGKKGCLGMCNKHYIQYKRWGDPLHSDKKERATIDGYYRDGKTGRREHRVIYEKYYGVILTKDEVIHHINFIKTDNRIENLWKYNNASEHIKAHRNYEKLMDSLKPNEEIVFENGSYIKRERERESIQTDSLNTAIFTTSLQGRASIQKGIIPSADNRSLVEITRGGHDNKYRKLRGIGEYSKRTNEAKYRRKQSKISDNVRVAFARQGNTDKSEYP